jgi:hypothetical protein
MPEKRADVSALLDLAADLMEEFGWQTDEYYESNDGVIVTANAEYVGGSMCTEGAIRAANRLMYMSEGKDSTTRDVFYAGHNHIVEMARDAVRDLIPPDPRLLSETDGGTIIKNIPWWNDEHCCSQEEAIGVLRDAATKTRPDA